MTVNNKDEKTIKRTFIEVLNSYSQNSPNVLETHPNNQMLFKSKIEIEIQEMKEQYQLKLMEIDALNKEIIQRDKESPIYNQSIIHQLNKNLSTEKKQLKKKSERELNSKLRKEIDRLQDEYQLSVRLLLSEHEIKVKLIKEEINRLRKEINAYNDKEKYISKEEHERIIFELKQKHQKELEPFEIEIAELEQYLSDTYPGIGNNKELTHPSSYFNNNNNNQDESYSSLMSGVEVQSNKNINDTENNSTINNNINSNETISFFEENEKLDEIDGIGIKQINYFANTIKQSKIDEI